MDASSLFQSIKERFPPVIAIYENEATQKEVPPKAQELLRRLAEMMKTSPVRRGASHEQAPDQKHFAFE